MEGWVKMWRKSVRHRLYPSNQHERFCKWAAWMDLILRATHRDYMAGDVEVKRGQLWTSQVALARRWGWERKTVRAFLRCAARNRELTHETARSGPIKGCMITICNYDDYQGHDSAMTHQMTHQSPISDPSNDPYTITREHENKNLASVSDSIPYAEIIADLNDVLGKSDGRGFRASTIAYRNKIKSLWKDYGLEDFKRVHRVKFAEWKDTKFAKYLDPDTLYAAGKFPKYAAQEERTEADEVQYF